MLVLRSQLKKTYTTECFILFFHMSYIIRIHNNIIPNH